MTDVVLTADVSVQRRGAHFLTESEPKCIILTKYFFSKILGVATPNPVASGFPFQPMLSDPNIFDASQPLSNPIPEVRIQHARWRAWQHPVQLNPGGQQWPNFLHAAQSAVGVKVKKERKTGTTRNRRATQNSVEKLLSRNGEPSITGFARRRMAAKLNFEHYKITRIPASSTESLNELEPETNNRILHC